MSRSKPSHGALPVSGSETSEEKIARLEAENAWLREQVAHLVERISALERRLGLNSRNSGQPPSSDGLKKPAAERRTRSLRGKTGRKPGGQAGHKGKTLCRTAIPDRVEEHVPSSCRGCGASLSSASPVGHPVARQVFDLPEPRPLEVTEHRGHARRCGCCGVVTRAAFPPGVSAPVPYGQRLAGAAVWLRHAHFLPEARLSQVMGVLFGARVSPATLAAMSGRAAGRLRDAAARIQALAASKARVKHLDETGLRIGGAHAVASCGLHALAGGVSHQRQARGRASGRDRRGGARPLAMLLADGGGGACALQRPSPAGVAGAGGVRQGRLGAAPAAASASGLARGPDGAGEGYRRTGAAFGAAGARLRQAPCRGDEVP